MNEADHFTGEPFRHFRVIPYGCVDWGLATNIVICKDHIHIEICNVSNFYFKQSSSFDE